ncbi:hypothetical protein [uncultured Hymenobacter sp.]|uniref:hypothetical protein n=1 Tax=uncultured Hymenobacter sp. TaxID=170016 RepID=UPI0035CB3C75
MARRPSSAPQQQQAYAVLASADLVGLTAREDSATDSRASGAVVATQLPLPRLTGDTQLPDASVSEREVDE